MQKNEFSNLWVGRLHSTTGPFRAPTRRWCIGTKAAAPCHSAEGGRAARLSLLASRKSLQAEKMLEKLEDRPAMSVEM